MNLEIRLTAENGNGRKMLISKTDTFQGDGLLTFGFHGGRTEKIRYYEKSMTSLGISRYLTIINCDISSFAIVPVTFPLY